MTELVQAGILLRSQLFEGVNWFEMSHGLLRTWYQSVWFPKEITWFNDHKPSRHIQETLLRECTWKAKPLLRNDRANVRFICLESCSVNLNAFLTMWPISQQFGKMFHFAPSTAHVLQNPRVWCQWMMNYKAWPLVITALGFSLLGLYENSTFYARCLKQSYIYATRTLMCLGGCTWEYNSKEI
jgi:hypothetical protein